MNEGKLKPALSAALLRSSVFGEDEDNLPFSFSQAVASSSENVSSEEKHEVSFDEEVRLLHKEDTLKAKLVDDLIREEEEESNLTVARRKLSEVVRRMISTPAAQPSLVTVRNPDGATSAAALQEAQDLLDEEFSFRLGKKEKEERKEASNGAPTRKNEEEDNDDMTIGKFLEKASMW